MAPGRIRATPRQRNCGRGAKTGPLSGLVVFALAVFPGCRPQGPLSASAARSNLVLISVDTLRADRLNSYGYTARQVSPHMDALARDGVLFENHITAAPWTTPAHLSLFTSLSPSVHGVMRPFGELRDELERDRVVDGLPEERITMAELLSAAGYRTAAFTGGVSLDPRLGFGQGFSRYDSSMFKLNPTNMEGLFAWVRAQQRDRFFLFWHTFEVHAPYLHATFVGEVLPAPIAEQVRRSTERVARLDLSRRGAPRQLSDDLARLGVLKRDVCEALYVGGVRAMDGWIGEFVRLLRDLGLYDHTLIVLTSDHGEELGDHSPDQIYNKHGRTVYEELVRVPLIVKLPQQQHAGARVPGVSRTVDVMPTVLQALGVPGGAQMEGVPLQPLWKGAADAPARIAFVEATILPEEKKAIRSDRYKYIVSIGEDSVVRYGRAHLPEVLSRRELYDLGADPTERHNLLAAAAPPADALADELEQALRRFVAAGGSAPGKVQLDREVLERLRALGYLN